MGGVPYGTSRIHQLSTTLTPTVDLSEWRYVHDDPGIELWIRGGFIPMFIHHLLNIERRNYTSDSREKHPDRKILSRANTTRGTENTCISSGNRRRKGSDDG